MFSGMPNLAAAIGYTNASWTLKCDLVCEYVCRLLTHMRTARVRRGHADLERARAAGGALRRPRSGYVLRSIEKFPKQAERAPWRLHQNYVKDLLLLRYGRNEHDELVFTRASRTASVPV